MKKFYGKTSCFLIAFRQRHFLIAFLSGLFAMGFFPAATVSDANGQTPIIHSEVETKSLTGEWVVDFNKNLPDQIEITFVQPSKKVPNAVGITFSISELNGLMRETITAAKATVNFNVVREAGALVWKGQFIRGRGTGIWSFTPNPRFLAAIRELGYGVLSEEDLLRAALRNLNAKDAEDLKAAGYDPVKFRQLLRTPVKEKK